MNMTFKIFKKKLKRLPEIYFYFQYLCSLANEISSLFQS